MCCNFNPLCMVIRSSIVINWYHTSPNMFFQFYFSIRQRKDNLGITCCLVSNFLVFPLSGSRQSKRKMNREEGRRKFISQPTSILDTVSVPSILTSVFLKGHTNIKQCSSIGYRIDGDKITIPISMFWDKVRRGLTPNGKHHFLFLHSWNEFSSEVLLISYKN